MQTSKTLCNTGKKSANTEKFCLSKKIFYEMKPLYSLVNKKVKKQNKSSKFLSAVPVVL